MYNFRAMCLYITCYSKILTILFFIFLQHTQRSSNFIQSRSNLDRKKRSVTDLDDISDSSSDSHHVAKKKKINGVNIYQYHKPSDGDSSSRNKSKDGYWVARSIQDIVNSSSDDEIEPSVFNISKKKGANETLNSKIGMCSYDICFIIIIIVIQLTPIYLSIDPSIATYRRSNDPNDHLNQYIKTIYMTEYKINNIEKEYNNSTSEEDKQKNFMDSKYCLYELSKYRQQTSSYFTSIHFSIIYIHITAREEVNAVCAVPQRQQGKFTAPPNSNWVVDQMFVQVPGQYNVVMRLKPRKSKGEPYYDKVSKKLMPLSNNDSEDSYYTKKDGDELPIDPNYDVLYDEDDESNKGDDNSSKNHSNDSEVSHTSN